MGEKLAELSLKKNITKIVFGESVVWNEGLAAHWMDCEEPLVHNVVGKSVIADRNVTWLDNYVEKRRYLHQVKRCFWV
jgi:hypothetical protein